MKARERIVLDTNTFISRLLIPTSVPGKAVQKAITCADVLFSEATIDELVDVLARPKFDRFLSVKDRQQFIRLLFQTIHVIPIVSIVRACRDSRDDKILEVGVNGRADLIVTGDKDLLTMKEFQHISIISPGAYLVR
jgi:uncharacterized protein